MSHASFPIWAGCLKCRHYWPAAYAPMEAVKCAQIMKKNSSCPKCGARGVMAKQERGLLQEPFPSGGRFFLAYDPSDHAKAWATYPWIIACQDQDGKIFDAEGYPIAPTAWAPMPDPQLGRRIAVGDGA